MRVRFGYFAAFVLVAAISACTGGLRHGQSLTQRTPRVDVLPFSIIGYHGETAMGLRVTNRTDHPLQLRLYVSVPASHPPPRAVTFSSPLCSGLHAEEEIMGRAQKDLQSCTFDAVAPGKVYKAALVVHDGITGGSDSLQFTFDLAESRLSAVDP
ncbi:MAG TPA: hypothetical protein VE871_02260 [Longimicrobium sp.]|nr:hypothetical protein [Longimicrobium sp.]